MKCATKNGRKCGAYIQVCCQNTCGSCCLWRSWFFIALINYENRGGPLLFRIRTQINCFTRNAEISMLPYTWKTSYDWLELVTCMKGVSSNSKSLTIWYIYAAGRPQSPHILLSVRWKGLWNCLSKRWLLNRLICFVYVKYEW